jgi:hypothetical protein
MEYKFSMTRRKEREREKRKGECSKKYYPFYVGKGERESLLA